jgi:hypothetical protein
LPVTIKLIFTSYLSLLFPFRFSLQLQFKFWSDEFEKKLRNFCPQFLFDLNGLFYFFAFLRNWSISSICIGSSTRYCFWPFLFFSIFFFLFFFLFQKNFEWICVKDWNRQTHYSVLLPICESNFFVLQII